MILLIIKFFVEPRLPNIQRRKRLAMSALVSSFVTKLLCQNQGSLELGRLRAVTRQSFTGADEPLARFLRDANRCVVAVAGEAGSARAACPPAADSVVVARTALRVCQRPAASGEHECDELHLCRYFVCGQCRYRNKCKNSHDLKSSHNLAVLKKEGLQDLQDSESEVFWLLLQNDDYLLPEICSHYNKGNGEHGSCKFKDGCTSLHVCLHFLQGDCKFGTSCKRAHAFDKSATKILEGRGLSRENIRKLQKLYKNKFLIASHKPESQAAKPALRQRPRRSSSSSASEAESGEICLFFVRKHCSFKERCIRVHYHLPYEWQVLDADGATWRDLPDAEDVERAFCNPGNDASNGVSPVDFVTMTSGAAPVRRLSTASSVTKPPHFMFTTEWLWYWRDEQGGWTEYGCEVDGKAAAITSQTLENLYLADAENDIDFEIANQQYRLFFKGMYQQNIRYKTKREVRRRPRFVSARQVQSKLKSGSTDSGSICVPPHWDQGALPDFTYKLVHLKNTAMEFRQVEQLFKQTMPHSTIYSIQRIQNTSLWRVFQWQKEQMEQKSKGKTVDERLLFHGTDPSLKEAICEQNFDWRICGVHGMMYGKGSYFARDASYSDRYSKPRGGTKIMFVALVLVGEFCRGNSSYLRPPAKGINGSFYDSCVDSESNPAIFVIFEKHQIYPQFLIEYYSDVLDSERRR
uniref:Poly (ADP-ribose) polymerase family, member 12a n=1 Tax=Scleropages formosus TaxID=113540 RepID=A0A8C9R5E4_SCLFO